MRAAVPTAYPKVRLIFCRARCPHRAVSGRPSVPPLRVGGILWGGRVRTPAPTAYPKVRLIFCRARCPHRAVSGRPSVPPLRDGGIFRFCRRGRRPRRPAKGPLRFQSPPSSASHALGTFPLVGGRLAGGRKGRPYGWKRTGRVGSANPGAGMEPHQRQFLQTQGPVARIK